MSPKETVSKLLCENKLGEGLSRKVYTNNYMPDYVIKVARNDIHFQNIREFHTYCFVKDLSIGKWFAPVMEISANGKVLIMRRTQPLTLKKIRVPEFFIDLKLENFGMLDGRIVCHDYGIGLYNGADLIAHSKRSIEVKS